MIGLNVGSGQRRFDTVGDWKWYNLDIQYKPPDQVPDLISNGVTAIRGMAADLIVLHHVLEHFGCGEADELVTMCLLSLKPKGSLLVFVPDTMAIARRYVLRQIDDYTLRVLTYGAYQGAEEDRHRWGYDHASLREYLNRLGGGVVKFFDWREIPGADLAKDWWILGMEAVKE